MDSRPHPKCVGQQFVREYYRIFNQAPQQIHRFYMENSTFKHGLLDENIDCQVKIIQDDYQATLGNGIAVQVIGELSNSGQPMRRFTQSFVLAYQPPNNYFIVNEFLRFKNIILSDQNGDHRIKKSREDEDAQSVTPVEHQTVQPTTNGVVKSLPLVPIVNSTINTDVVLQKQIETPKLATTVPTTPDTPSVVASHLISKQVPAAKASIQTQQRAWKTKPQIPPPVNAWKINRPARPPSQVAQQLPQQNGQIVAPQLATADPTTPVSPSVVASHLISQRVPAAKASIQTQQRAWKTKPQKPESVTQIQIENIEVVGEETVESQTVESPIKQEKDLRPEHANETETSSTSLNSAASTSPVDEWKIKQTRRIRKPKPPTISPLEHPETASSTSANTSGAIARAQGGRGAKGSERGGNNVRGMNRNDRPGPTTRAYYKNEDNGITKYSDEQQLFLGNIPTYVTEEELKKFFTKFGNVIDVRIFINRNINNMPEDRVRNFGNIIFETMESAKSVLVEKRIIFSDQNGNHRINVQEKKPRAKQAMDGSRIRESGNSMAAGHNDAKGNGVEKNDNQVANNVQSGSGGVSGGSPKIRDGDTGRGMPRRGDRGGSGGGRGRGGGNMPRGTGSRRN